MTRRDDAFATARLSKCKTDWEKAKKLRSKVVDMCNSAKNDHIKNNLHDNKHKPKKFWEQLLEVWGTGKQSSRVLLRKNDNNISLSNPLNNSIIPKKDTTDAFNDFFANIAQKIQQNIPPLSPAETKQLDTAIGKNREKHNVETSARQFIFRDITNAEVKKFVKSIKVHKSSGIDGISSNLFFFF